MKNHYILIDFENVQPRDVALLHGQEFKLMIFVGATQNKLQTEMVCAVQSLGANAEYVRIEGSGRNALDFHIAYHLGRTAVEQPKAEIYVISKDTGFDPLMRYLKAKGIACRRLTSLSDIPGLKPAAATPVADPVQKVINNLVKRGAGKPRTVKTLRSTILQLLGKTGTEEAVSKVLVELERRNAVKIADGKVTYSVP